jgi:3-hydroxyisobutyrate dehydrogenase-like beta-hydroxyacid dehydrogenase
VRIAFCGLGNMGAPMAGRFLEAGHQLAVWNRTADRAAPLRERGAVVAATPAEAARRAEVTITMLADAAAVDEVVFGENGVADVAREGTAIIDMSTIGPDAARSIAARAPEGVDVLDAPVKGGPARATDGSLKILVGASDAAYERWSPLLSALGEPKHMGPVGTGAAAKILNNYAVIILVSVLGEAMGLADALGLEEAPALEILRGTPIEATLRHQWARATGAAPASFRMKLAAKDLELAVRVADDDGRGIELGTEALRRLREAIESGDADKDQAAVIPFIRAGRGG